MNAVESDAVINDLKPINKNSIILQNSCQKFSSEMNSNSHLIEKENTSMETNGKMHVHTNHVTFQRTYKVIYVGYAVLDRRYTLPMLPWVIAEIKRHGSQNIEDIFLEVTEHSLKAVNCESNELVFEHKLQIISKFAQTSHDPTCFTYMTREVVDGPCAFHVFQANDENTVLELFTTVREVTKEMQNQQYQDPPLIKTASGVALDSFICTCQNYEVLYIGRIKVSGKRAPPSFIDDAVQKFRLYELEKARSHQNLSETRHRHGSGTSISSLPYNLDLVEKPNENGLQRYSHNGSQDFSSSSGQSSCENVSCKSLDIFSRECRENYSNPFIQSPLSPVNVSEQLHKFPYSDNSLITHSQSIDATTASKLAQELKNSKCSLMPPSSLITHTQSLDTKGCADLAHDLRDLDPSLTLRDRVRSCSGDSPRSKQTSLPVFRTRVGSGGSNDMRRPRAFTSPVSSNNRHCNRTMLFLIGRLEICLIGMDKKQMLLSKTFNDIAHCSQGVKYLDHFGFICRETTINGSDCYAGYIFRCQTEQVVDELMQTLKLAFKRAHQEYQHHLHPKNTQVPKIIICDSCPMHWFHLLCSEIEGLPEESAHLIILQKIGVLADSDKAEIMSKYQNEDFDDIQEQNEILMMLLRNFCEQKQLKHDHNSFGISSKKNDYAFLKEKSSSKLDSFRQKAKKSLSNSFETFLKLKNRDDGRERSTTSLSDNAIPYTVIEDHEPNAKDLDTRSYRESSYDNSDRTLSGRASPFMIRPRSSTFSSSREVQKSSKKHSPKQDIQQNKSPIMNIFMKVGNQKSPPTESDEKLSPDQKGSWRQAIFHRVQTPVPVKQPNREYLKRNRRGSNSTSEDDSKVVVRKTREELRALWKKAIMEQILLIRMEKENKKLQVSQDAASHKRMKLNYEEITPCLKAAVIKWEEILDNPKRIHIEMDKSKLMELVKMGVPRHKRGEIWQYLAEQHCVFWEKPINQDPEIDLTISYEELLKQLTSQQHAILIDLGRTFPNHPYYSQPLGAGQLSLFNLLKAYSLLDKEVGYCQGLSFVAGILLLHMPEERAFLMMKHILFYLGLRKQYKPDMVALQIQMYQLSRLIHDNYRELYDHLERYDIAPTLYAAPWFLTLFASQFPLGFVARLFDLIFLQGTDVIFKVSLVLLGNHKEALLSCHGFETIMEFLKTSLPAIGVIEMERIFNQVFSLDISHKLHSYEVEYHVLQEEMMHSPSKSNQELQNLQTTNKNLKTKNMELMEQLQVAYSTINNLQSSEASYKSTIQRLEARISSLEEEKDALLHSLNIMKKRLQVLEMAKLESGSETSVSSKARVPSFGLVYALAGSEKEEEEHFKQLMKDICQGKEKMDEEEDVFDTIKEEIQSELLVEPLANQVDNFTETAQSFQKTQDTENNTTYLDLLTGDIPSEITMVNKDTSSLNEGHFECNITSSTNSPSVRLNPTEKQTFFSKSDRIEHV